MLRIEGAEAGFQARRREQREEGDAEGRERELNQILLTTLRGTSVLALMAAGAVFALAHPIIKLA